jgi:hypothetical protein
MIPDFRRASKSLRRAIPKPRLFKSHEFFNPRYHSLIYLVRDVRAVALSQWNWRNKKGMNERWRYKGDFDKEYIKKFINGEIFPGCWRMHVEGWTYNGIKYKKRLILRYEDIFKNTPIELALACSFLDIDYTPEIIKNAIKAFPPGKPSGILKASNKPLKASPTYWKKRYTEEMLGMMNARYKSNLERFGYEI